MAGAAVPVRPSARLRRAFAPFGRAWGESPDTRLRIGLNRGGPGPRPDERGDENSARRDQSVLLGGTPPCDDGAGVGHHRDGGGGAGEGWSALRRIRVAFAASRSRLGSHRARRSITHQRRPPYVALIGLSSPVTSESCVSRVAPPRDSGYRRTQSSDVRRFAAERRTPPRQAEARRGGPDAADAAGGSRERAGGTPRPHGPREGSDSWTDHASITSRAP
jgi:hypothetical protein